MADTGETAEERGGFGFDSDLDIDVDPHGSAVEDSEPVADTTSTARADTAPKQTADDDDISAAKDLEELKAALRKRSPTREDRAALDARLVGMSDMERELVELRAWRKANEKPATPKAEPEKPVDEWDEMLGKGPAWVRSAAQAEAKKEVEAALKEIAALRGELTERDQRTERTRQVESREALIKRHPDAHEALLKFRDLAAQYPGLEKRALEAKDPAQFAYDQAKQYERTSSYANYEDFIRGEAARLAGETQSADAVTQLPTQPTRSQAKPRPLTLAANGGRSVASAAGDQDHWTNF